MCFDAYKAGEKWKHILIKEAYLWDFLRRKNKHYQFPFDDQQNTACIVCCHILEGHPILYVSHDEDDGMWQFFMWKQS